MIIDDTLALGETLCAVLRVLKVASVIIENVSILVVAEFPMHRGREMLRKRGFLKVSVRSLLVFNGA